MPTTKKKRPTVPTISPPSLTTDEALALTAASTPIADGDDRGYLVACELFKRLKAARRRIVDEFLEIRRPFNEGLEKIRGLERQMVQAIDARLAVLDPAIRDWRSAEDLRRLEAARLEQLQREAQARAEREAQAAAAAAVAQATTSPAAKAELERYASAIAAAPIAPVHVAPTFVPKVLTEREYWRAEVVDLAALVQAVAAGQASPDLLQPNLPALNELARANKEFFAVPGCRAVKTEKLVDYTKGPTR